MCIVKALAYHLSTDKPMETFVCLFSEPTFGPYSQLFGKGGKYSNRNDFFFQFASSMGGEYFSSFGFDSVSFTENLID